jgi:hypothetical protein
MLSYNSRTGSRQTRQDLADQRQERPLPKTLVNVLECDLAQLNKLTKALFGPRRS